MKIPKIDGTGFWDIQSRLEFYSEIVQRCFISRQKRIGDYERLRRLFMYGENPVIGASSPYNKIQPSIETLVSFLFAADSTRFSTHFGAGVPKDEWQKAPVVTGVISDEWSNTKSDDEFAESVKWSLVFGCVPVKQIVKNHRVYPSLVLPADFGVYREDVSDLDDQEAFAMRFTITPSELSSRYSDHEHIDYIVSQVGVGTAQESQTTGSLRTIVMNQSALGGGSPPITDAGGGVGSPDFSIGQVIEYIPEIDPELIEGVELWIWDDDLEDYRTVTILGGTIIISDVPNVFLPKVDGQDGDHPFIPVRPKSLPGYFWGESMVARLENSQQMRDERVQQIRNLLAKQANPPFKAIGTWGPVDELQRLLGTPGGGAVSPESTSSIDQLTPEIPADLWRDVDVIDGNFAEITALGNLLMGRGEHGVRSGRQTTELAKLGSARIKSDALKIESALDSYATKLYRALRRYNDTKYSFETEDGKEVHFILNQVTSDVVIRVDGHSNSPLFADEHKQDAMALHEAGAIDAVDLLDQMSPPNKELMQKKAKKRMAAQAQAQQDQMKIEQAKATKGAGA